MNTLSFMVDYCKFLLLTPCLSFRVQNQSSEIYNVLCTTPTQNRMKSNGYTPSPNRSDSFNRLFGSPDQTDRSTPRRTPINKKGMYKS